MTRGGAECGGLSLGFFIRKLIGDLLVFFLLCKGRLGCAFLSCLGGFFSVSDLFVFTSSPCCRRKRGA
ncbi:hypothetical protein HOY80DRAFT_67899 [Tuber brumale]|nr:hypothetical protein HOY80DRAFT_67899 [Tuber brumale]